MKKYLYLIDLFRRYQNWLKGESLEQANFVLWLEQNGYTYTHIPNATWTTSIKQKIMNTMLGLNPGAPDLMIILKRNSLLFIEMKKRRTRKKNGELKALGSDGIEISEDQKKWKNELGRIENVDAKICYGATHAIQAVEYFEKK